LNTKVSKGSVATRLRRGGVINDQFVTQSLLSLLVKEFWKSINIWRDYWQEYSVCLFLTHGVCMRLLCGCLAVWVRICQHNKTEWLETWHSSSPVSTTLDFGFIR